MCSLKTQSTKLVERPIWKTFVTFLVKIEEIKLVYYWIEQIKSSSKVHEMSKINVPELKHFLKTSTSAFILIVSHITSNIYKILQEIERSRVLSINAVTLTVLGVVIGSGSSV